MSKVRCISSDILENDNFTSLPMSAKMLYVYINNETDNLGFIDNMDIIVAKAKAKKKDIQLLIDREYLYKVKDWLYLEVHFRLNNKNLRPERGAKSRFGKYLDEYELDEERGMYLPTNCRQNADKIPTNCPKNSEQYKVKENKVKETNINQSNSINTVEGLRELMRGSLA